VVTVLFRTHSGRSQVWDGTFRKILRYAGWNDWYACLTSRSSDRDGVVFPSEQYGFFRLTKMLYKCKCLHMKVQMKRRLPLLPTRLY
jgi:hypothetical protein